MNDSKHLTTCNSTNSINNDIQKRPTNCQEMKNKCNLLCSTNNPIDRVKYYENGCCVVSPIPTTVDSFKPFVEPLFSKRTSFQYQDTVVEVVITLKYLN